MHPDPSGRPLPAVDTFLPYMRDVTRCEQALHELGQTWRMIDWSARLNCPAEAQALLPAMAATRSGFQRLEEDLVASLVREKVDNVLEGIGTQAQYAIDLVVRNLYERTADIGFLATDNELCAFAAGLSGDARAARRRLRAYRSKYTVYNDIVILDPQGRVQASIDESAPAASTDPLVAATLASAGHVETFRASDLQPGRRVSLIYSRRMLHPDTGVPVGVLCLCFEFEDEMAGIFRALADADGRTLMLLLDADGRVLASGDPAWAPPGATVPVNRGGDARLLLYGGREYLVRTRAAAGYQGYAGPAGWLGQVMTPVDVAFRRRHRAMPARLPDGLADGLQAQAAAFCPPLSEIVDAAEGIRRVVWNGQVATAGSNGDAVKLRALLDQIGETGQRSSDLFGKSIGELVETVLASVLRDAESRARLLVDLLDRNLYERADDCRWWALAPELRRAFDEPEQDFETRAGLGTLLGYINGLYTVYTRIFVYDREGRIVASSDRDGGPCAVGDHAGGRVDPATLAAVLALPGEQRYHATPFRPDPLYDGRATWLYHAAIRATADGSATGGIGLVFDAQAELHAMLKDALGGQAGMSALFVDRAGNVLASTDPARPVGGRLDLDPAMLALANGAHASRMVVHDGQYAVMACSASSGYREFKTSDGYRDDVLAVVFRPFGPARARRTARGAGQAIVDETAAAPGSAAEFATFFVEGMLFAVPAVAVREARSAAGITRVSMGSGRERIGLVPCMDDDGEERYVWVFDLACMMGGAGSAIGPGSQVIVLRHGGNTIAILADDLHAVPKFSPAQMVPAPFAAGPGGQLVKQVIRANGGALLVQALDVAQLFACVGEPGLAPAPPVAA